MRFNEAEREKSQRNNRRNFLNDITKDRAKVKKIMQEYYRKLNWGNWDHFRKAKLIQYLKFDLCSSSLLPSFNQFRAIKVSL